MTIAEVRIHPAIGIARVGDSDSGYFVGPERRWDHAGPSDGLYKDRDGRIKRQAARFRIFAYGADGVPISELTADEADIEWTVHLANRKAIAPRIHQERLRRDRPPTLRNSDYQEPRRGGLVVDPGARNVNGRGQRRLLDGGTFTVGGQSRRVSLGEIRTDRDGTLLVFGGLGSAESPTLHEYDESGDSDEWYDDISDGPVTATVTVRGERFTAAGAWAIVGPPKFAPPIDSVVRLWDKLFDQLASSARKFAVPSYVDDIYPILQAANDVGAVNDGALGVHGFTHPVPGSADVLSRVMRPRGARHMPKLESEADRERLDLSLTGTQIEMIRQWANNDVPSNWDRAWGAGPPPPDAEVTPDGMDKAALENCVGGALRPGIEAGHFLLDERNYLPTVEVNEQPSFRLLDKGEIEPGAVTAEMSLPWQADFYACSSSWWPVPRPNEVTVAGADPAAGREDWMRSIDQTEFIDGGWTRMGFVTRQAEGLVETERT